MNDRIKIYEDLNLLVKMTRAKGDGLALKFEREELQEKIEEYNTEIDELNMTLDAEMYDANAEMADRNMEIITKKNIKTIEVEIKNKKNRLEELKEEETKLNKSLETIRKNKKSHDDYLKSIKERTMDVKETDIKERYKTLINETEDKINALTIDLETKSSRYEEVQNEMESISNELRTLEEKQRQKEVLLEETIFNLANKDSYIDQTKKEKKEQKIGEIEKKKARLEKRISEIEEDPKYLELKIKEIVASSKNNATAKDYLTKLAKKASSQPYMDAPVNNALEEELLKATQARDTFANEIEQKNYNLMDASNPDQIRISYLQDRINNWNNDLITIQDRIALIDTDSAYNYQQKQRDVNEMIEQIKEDIKEFEIAFEEEPESNITAKASLKVALEEKRQDLEVAEEIAAQFRKEEAEEINAANHMTRVEIDELVHKINMANEEINKIKSRILTKKSGLIDISAKNKDKAKLKELAEVVINIKHRRQFIEQPNDVIKRLEKALNTTLEEKKENTKNEKNKEELLETLEN